MSGNIEKVDYKKMFDYFKEYTKKRNRQIKQGLHDYSLMNALLKKTDEVYLHSNFIYSMINPDGDHYQKSKFLQLFLKAIGEDNFIQHENAQVYREKGKIDLLIYDKKHVIIIENKLRAKDQEKQISRYINYVISVYFNGDKKNLEEKLHIVYLSQYKPAPAQNSIIGFELEGVSLVWRNKNVNISLDGKRKDFSLENNTKLKFNHVRHAEELDSWSCSCIAYLKDYGDSVAAIKYAFMEYRLILKRLKTNQWRNVMGFDNFIEELDDNEQKQMYDLIIEVQKESARIAGKILYKKLKEYFIGGMKIIDGTKEFTEENCIRWFKKSGNKDTYRDVGFSIVFNQKAFVFGLGVENIIFAEVSNADQIKKETFVALFEKEKIGNRDQNIFSTVEAIVNKTKTYNE